jgi:hypothetical protein
MYAARCSPKAQRVIAPVGKATIRRKYASSSTQRSPTREITLACHKKVTSFHHTFRSQVGLKLPLRALWLNSSNFGSYTSRSRRNNNYYNSYDKL